MKKPMVTRTGGALRRDIHANLSASGVVFEASVASGRHTASLDTLPPVARAVPGHGDEDPIIEYDR